MTIWNMFQAAQRLRLKYGNLDIGSGRLRGIEVEDGRSGMDYKLGESEYR
jgi:hypothetical protein